MSATFAGIYRAALEICLDNGGINRWRPVFKQRQEFEDWIAWKERTQKIQNLCEIDDWLKELSDADLNMICCSPPEECEDLWKKAPDGTNALLNAYFDDVC